MIYCRREVGMEKTFFGNCSHIPCSDCGGKNSYALHWGKYVPPREIGSFCHECWDKRIANYACGNAPEPLHLETKIVTFPKRKPRT